VAGYVASGLLVGCCEECLVERLPREIERRRWNVWLSYIVWGCGTTVNAANAQDMHSNSILATQQNIVY